MNAIILCGGLSTRLGDITKNIPKVLLTIGPRRVLDWQLLTLRDLGIKEVVLAGGHLAQILQKEVGDECCGAKITYALEKERLGTGGAIKNALSHVPASDEPTIILNGDILAGVDYRQMASDLRPGTDGLILAAEVPDASSYGTLVYESDKHLKAFKEKEGFVRPGYINGGVYIFNPQVKKYFPETKAFSIEYDVFPKMKDLYVFETTKPWVDVGVPDRLAWARENWQIFERVDVKPL